MCCLPMGQCAFQLQKCVQDDEDAGRCMSTYRVIMQEGLAQELALSSLRADVSSVTCRCEVCCKKRFGSINALLAHGRSTGHRTSVAMCEACGRYHQNAVP